jgi:hypothetical protein
VVASEWRLLGGPAQITATIGQFRSDGLDAGSAGDCEAARVHD